MCFMAQNVVSLLVNIPCELEKKRIFCFWMNHMN